MSHRCMAQARSLGQAGVGRGYYRMARGWLDHEIFGGDRYCRRAAWEWLIEHAVWRARAITIRGTTYTLRRGQLSYSLSYLAEGWQWTIPQVRGFLAKLTTQHMIRTEHVTGSRTSRLVVTVCNYDRYQGDDAAERTASDTEPAHNSHKEKRANPASKAPGGASPL